MRALAAICLLLLLVASGCGNHARSAQALAAEARIKALLCTGDYGMWAQDRVPLIENAVEAAAPGQVVWKSDQSYNFVKKLEAPGYVEQFDVIVVGDVGIGEMTTKAQQALVDFVNQGGGLVYDMDGKSTLAFRDMEAVPMPLSAILPYQYPDTDPQKNRRADAARTTSTYFNRPGRWKPTITPIGRCATCVGGWWRRRSPALRLTRLVIAIFYRQAPTAAKP